MNILIDVNTFSTLTGSELYCYELSREFRARGHRVTVAAAATDGIVAAKDEALGVRVAHIESIPFDAYYLIHVNPNQAGTRAVKSFPKLPVVDTVHSENPALEKFERPVKSRMLKKFIAVRPAIADVLIDRFGVSPAQVEVVYNPIDLSRFNREGTSDNGRPLFAGPNDFLRARVIARWEGKADFIGRGFPAGPVWKIEDFIKRCSRTLGIGLGRTTIEGWACGKSGLIYEVDGKGAIISEADTPPPADLSRFDSSRVAETLLAIYRKIL